VAQALRERGAEHLAVLDTDTSQADALVARLNAQAGTTWAESFPSQALAERLGHADGLVMAEDGDNAVTSGVTLADDLRHDQWIFDTRYDPTPTPLVRAAKSLGCQVLHGGGALVNGAASTFRLVTGLSPHTPHMFADYAELTAGPVAHT
jgi:shikimate dehydrogenase